MRVAFLSVGDPTRQTGGYLYHARVFAGLRERGIDLVEVSAGAAGLAAQRANAPAFGQQFDPRPFDLVVVDALARAVCAPWLDQWRAARPLVALVHELPSVAHPDAANRALEAALLRADRLIAVSAHGAAILVQRGVEAARIEIVAPGCDRLAHTMAANQTVAPRRVICVAQWIARKGITTLVAAWGLLAPQDAVLELIGETDADAPYQAEVTAALAHLPAPARVVVRGVIADAALTEAYANAACFALPSCYEGYGMAFAEALVAGLPIIACPVGPVTALVGAAGLFVPPHDPAALSAALERILAEPQLRRRLAAAARQRATEIPTWAQTTERFQWVLEAASACRR